MIDLVTRSEWGARYSDGFRDRPMPFSEFWLHHSVTIAPDLVAPFTDDDRAVRTLEDIGQSRFGGGISYNQPVTPVGRVYVGVSPHRQGAHTKGHNTVGFAFVLVGDYTRRAPTAAQEEAIAKRMVELHRQGKATRHTLNGGHRDASGNSTDCPGDAAEARVPYINRRAIALWDAGYPNAVPTPPTPVPTLEVPDMFLVQQENVDPVYKSDGFRRVHVTRVERDALLKVGVKLTVFKTAAEVEAFGPVVEVTA